MNTSTNRPANRGEIKRINKFASDAIGEVISEIGLNLSTRRVIEDAIKKALSDYLSLHKFDTKYIIENRDEFTCEIRQVVYTLVEPLLEIDKHGEEVAVTNYPEFVSEAYQIVRSLLDDWLLGLTSSDRIMSAVPASSKFGLYD